MGGGGEEDEHLPLFETKAMKGRLVYRVFSVTIFVGICLILAYRLLHILRGGERRWGWILMFASELWFGFYWFITQFPRWNPIFRNTFRHRLSLRNCIKQWRTRSKLQPSWDTLGTPNCLPTLCYLILPPLYHRKGIALFPKVSLSLSLSLYIYI
ncbi:hypothetical protein GIB67_013451, partial [Kingdonia uniflora]